MSQRLVSAIIMLPLLIILVLRGVPLYVGGLILMCIALYEFYNAFKNIDIKPISEVGYLFAFYLLISNILKWNHELYPLILFIAFIVSIIYVLLQKRDVIDVAITMVGILYICFFFNYIVLTVDTVSNGYIYVWLIFLISFSTDIFAYLVGRRYGKRKLLPKVSPKKTIEGSIGGIVGTILVCFIFGLFFKLSIILMIFLAITGSIVAQIGDLTASSIKRYCGLKDFGNIIPGHGGELDRFDSVLLVAPYVYFILMFFVR